MRKFSRVDKIWLMVMLTLFSFALISCYEKIIIVMPEARAVKLQQGEPAPFPGWLLTDSAMASLLERAEQCKEDK
jgi:hypothetical protein